MLKTYWLVLSFSDSSVVLVIVCVSLLSPIINSNSAVVWLEPSSELCTQYNITFSPTIAVVVEAQVVGAAGALPIVIDTISDQPDSPCSFIALTLKKYSWPDSSPVT